MNWAADSISLWIHLNVHLESVAVGTAHRYTCHWWDQDYGLQISHMQFSECISACCSASMRSHWNRLYDSIFSIPHSLAPFLTPHHYRDVIHIPWNSPAEVEFQQLKRFSAHSQCATVTMINKSFSSLEWESHLCRRPAVLPHPKHPLTYFLTLWICLF